MTDQNQAAAADAPAVVAPVVDTGPQKTKFFFKSRKEKQIDPDTKKEKEVVIPAPKAIEMVLPLLDVDAVLGIFSSGDEKQISLALEAMNKVVQDQARSLIDEDIEKARTEGLPADQLTWDFISKIPPATRRGGGIEDSVWEAFILDYTAVMQQHGKEEKQAETGGKLLAKRFGPVKDNKKVVGALQRNLLVWWANTSKQEDFTEVYQTLASKAETLMAKDEDAVLAAI